MTAATSTADDLLRISAYDLARLTRGGEVSAFEVALAAAERTRHTEPKLGAFITTDLPGMVAAASALDQDRAAGAEPGLLHGVPVAVKDNLAVAGLPTTAGTAFLRDHTTARDAESVRRLRRAGAVVPGKTGLHEFAYGATGVNPHYGTPTNPWRAGYVPGGSSSGSGVSVLARQVPLALGTDAAGSIRMPASLCGIVGLKPTHGRVSARGLLASHNATVDHVGPLARTVLDAALGLQAIAGYDPADPLSLDEPVPDYCQAVARAESLRGVRIGVPTGYFFDGVDTEVEAGVRAAMDHMARLGAELVDVDIADLADMMPLRLALFADGLAFHGSRLRVDHRAYGEEVRARLLTDCFVTAQDAARANRVRRLLQARFKDAFVHHRLDLLVTPTTPIPAVPVEQWMVSLPRGASGALEAEPVGLTLLRLTAPANLTGLPAISVPAGFTRAEGLPFGVQFMAPPFHEAEMLAAAHVYEQDAGWWRRQPPNLDLDTDTTLKEDLA